MTARLLRIVLLLFVGLQWLPAQAQWTAQNSGLPGTLTITALDVVDANVVWAVAGNRNSPQGVVSTSFTRTTNGGTTWAPGQVPLTGSYFVGVSAVDASYAWVAMRPVTTGTGGAILRTTDGGQTWTQQTSAFGTGGAVSGLHFFDRTQGVAVGNPNGGFFEIYTTADGGSTWLRVATAAIPAPLTGETVQVKSVVAVGNSVWFGTSAGRIFRSTDRGLTWRMTATGMAQATLLAFNDELSGLAMGMNNFSVQAMRTRDGGVTWQSVTPAGAIGEPTDLAAIPGRPGTHVTGRGGTNSSLWGSSFTVKEGAGWVNIDNVFHGAVGFYDAQTGWSGGPASATNECIIYKGKVPGIGDCVNVGGGNCGDITQVQLVGTSLNSTASNCQPGRYLSTYPMAGNTTARLLVGGSYQLRVTCSRSVNLWMFFDVNASGTFDAGDVTAGNVSVPANTPQLFNFNISKFAPTGVNLLRIRTSDPAPLSPGSFSICDAQTSGETRDYFLTTGDFLNGSDSTPLCEPGYYTPNACLGNYIQNVQLTGTTLDNSSGCLPTASVQLPYANYAASGSATGTVTPGVAYTLRVTSPFDALASAWFDWNRDNVFSSSEWVQLPQLVANQPASAQVTVPAGVAFGSVRLRVRSSARGEANNANAACANFALGETEDYTLQVGPATAVRAGQRGAVVLVAPNPTPDGQLTLTWPAAHPAASLRVLNVVGQEVRRLELPAQQLSQQVDLSALPAGVYVLHIATPTQSSTVRVVRQ